MPEASASVTASVPEQPPVHHHDSKPRKKGWRVLLWRFWPLFAIAGVGIFFFVWLGASTTKPSKDCAFKIPENPSVMPRRMTQCVRLEQARTNSALTLGLSGRHSMPRDQGLLFVFAEPSKQCMWMKDMHFALDMLWLDDQHKIIHIEIDVKPESYPASYCGPSNTKYVVELNTDTVDQAGLHDGQILDL
jgi:uncharacterized membrane protein (UPF0127 family)